MVRDLKEFNNKIISKYNISYSRGRIIETTQEVIDLKNNWNYSRGRRNEQNIKQIICTLEKKIILWGGIYRQPIICPYVTRKTVAVKPTDL